MEIWIATGNKGKLNEYKSMLEGKGFEVHSQSELDTYYAPPETGKTFEENARIKAKSLKAMKPGVWVVGEDSGLEVSGLNNLPGIHSARYAGEKASDAENTAKLLKMMSIRSANTREARFVCTVIAYDPEGKEHILTDELKGQITRKAMGNTGFGYDPIFAPEGSEKTLAELGAGEKNQISHRSKVIRKFLELAGGN